MGGCPYIRRLPAGRRMRVMHSISHAVPVYLPDYHSGFLKAFQATWACFNRNASHTTRSTLHPAAGKRPHRPPSLTGPIHIIALEYIAWMWFAAREAVGAASGCSRLAIPAWQPHAAPLSRPSRRLQVPRNADSSMLAAAGEPWPPCRPAPWRRLRCRTASLGSAAAAIGAGGQLQEATPIPENMTAEEESLDILEWPSVCRQVRGSGVCVQSTATIS
jgi:hypothetical protein